MEPLQLLQTKKEWLFFVLVFTFIFCFNLFFEYGLYQDIKSKEVYSNNFQIKNIYPKDNRNIVKLSNNKITFFTSVPLDTPLKQLDFVSIYFITKNISFIDYLKGFYAPSFGIEKQIKTPYQKNMIEKIEQQHSNTNIRQIYKALFLAIPLPSNIQEQNAIFGISHLFAISGFHLGVIVGFLYLLLQLFYTPIHKYYFPYRNKQFDILILSGIILFFYLLYIDMVASFLRSFVMFLLGLFLLRSNIKILSFKTLFLTLIFIIALFPKLLFSLSLWFSIFGVFYIFLFFHYFSHLSKTIQFILFNIFIFLSINPLVHYFFDISSLAQLFSPIWTLLFSLFYPISFLLHLFDMGYLFDPMLEYYLKYKTTLNFISTPLWLFLLYIALSIASIWSKKSFYSLVVTGIGFNLYLYIS